MAGASAQPVGLFDFSGTTTLPLSLAEVELGGEANSDRRGTEVMRTDLCASELSIRFERRAFLEVGPRGAGAYQRGTAEYWFDSDAASAPDDRDVGHIRYSAQMFLNEAGTTGEDGPIESVESSARTSVYFDGSGQGVAIEPNGFVQFELRLSASLTATAIEALDVPGSSTGLDVDLDLPGRRPSGVRSRVRLGDLGAAGPDGLEIVVHRGWLQPHDGDPHRVPRLNADATLRSIPAVLDEPVASRVASLLFNVDMVFASARMGCSLADWNSDGAIDTDDFTEYLQDWSIGARSADIIVSGVRVGANRRFPSADIDGVVDLSDFSHFLSIWGEGCP